MNEDQYHQFHLQSHIGHHEAYNMPEQSMMQQPSEFELLMATMERERDLLSCGESASRKGLVIGHYLFGLVLSRAFFF